MNPFRYGALALDEAFTDREDEIARARRRTSSTARTSSSSRRGGTGSRRSSGASSQELVERGRARRPGRPDDDADEGAACREARRDDSRGRRLTPCSVRASGCGSSRGLRITPDRHRRPGRRLARASASMPVRRREDVDATLERLLELPGQLAAERGRKRGARPRRVPGGRRHRPRPPEAHALRLPGAARGRTRLPRAASAT